jgi:hypothetical protein
MRKEKDMIVGVLDACYHHPIPESLSCSGGSLQMRQFKIRAVVFRIPFPY